MAPKAKAPAPKKKQTTRPKAKTPSKTVKPKAAPKKRAPSKAAAKPPRQKASTGAASEQKPAAQPPVEKKPTGRPTIRNEELLAEICDRIAEGEPLRQICRDPDMPSWRTIYHWRLQDPDLFARFAEARAMGFDAIAEDSLEIADNAMNDWMEQNAKDDVAYKLNGEHVQRSKLRIETRLKLLSKWDPARYGEKIQQEVSGKDGAPIQPILNVTVGGSK